MGGVYNTPPFLPFCGIRPKPNKRPPRRARSPTTCWRFYKPRAPTRARNARSARALCAGALARAGVRMPAGALARARLCIYGGCFLKVKIKKKPQDRLWRVFRLWTGHGGPPHPKTRLRGAWRPNGLKWRERSMRGERLLSPANKKVEPQGVRRRSAVGHLQQLVGRDDPGLHRRHQHQGSAGLHPHDVRRVAKPARELV